MVKRMSTTTSAFTSERWAALRRAVLHMSAAFCLAAALIAAPALSAKEKDTKPKRSVHGLVSDASENPISGATVTLTNVSDAKQLASYTGQDGRYSFSGLETTSDYEVQAAYKGVSSKTRKISIIDSRTRITMNLQIPPPAEEGQ